MDNVETYVKGLWWWTCFHIKQEGSEAKVEFYKENVSKEAKIKGLYNGEDGKSGEFELSQTEPGKFEASIPMEELGFYNFSIKEEEDGEIKNNYKGSFSLQYSEEYKFNNNVGKLDTIVKETSGSFINKPEEVFTGEFEKEYKKINLTTPLLVISIILFMLDIAYRRLNLDFMRYFKNRRRDKVKLAEEKLAKAKFEKNKEIFSNEKVQSKSEKLNTTVSNDNSKNKKENNIENLVRDKVVINVNEDSSNKNSEIDKIDKKPNKKKENTSKDEKKETLDTSMLLKKKSDRKKI